MTDRSAFDPFEQRLAAEMERLVAGATDPTPAAEIAAEAMRPRGVGARIRRSRNSRRLLLLGLAAVFLVPAAYFGALRLTPTRTDLYDAIVVRPTTGPQPGVDVVAIRSDGFERLLRTVPDSVLPNGNTILPWGSVSRDGWLELAATTTPWRMVLIDLRNDSVQPWVVDGADLDAIAPSWGPGGLVAAAGDTRDSLAIVDPAAHSVRQVQLTGGLIGGGPSIVWTAGGGILETDGSLGYKTLNLDGSSDTPGVAELYDSRQLSGPDGSQLRLCQTSTDCPPDGRLGWIQRVDLKGTVTTIYQREPGTDRPVGADFTGLASEYWLLFDHSDGRQFRLATLDSAGLHDVATIDRASTWGTTNLGPSAPDRSVMSLLVYDGSNSGAVIVPTQSGVPTVHSGTLAGFMDGLAAAAAPGGSYARDPESLPPGGQRYVLPSVDELIATEASLNPGTTVIAKDERDGISGDTTVHDYKFSVDKAGTGDMHLDCYGPALTVVTVGDNSLENPCSNSGDYARPIQVTAGEEITVETTGDTSWRMVVYGSPQAAPGSTPPPVPSS